MGCTPGYRTSREAKDDGADNGIGAGLGQLVGVDDITEKAAQNLEAHIARNYPALKRERDEERADWKARVASESDDIIVTRRPALHVVDDNDEP